MKSRELGGSDDIVTQMLWRQVLARVRAYRGEPAEAERLAREAVAYGEQTDMLVNRGVAHLDLAEAIEPAAAEKRPCRLRRRSTSSSARATCRWPSRRGRALNGSSRLSAMRVLVTGGAGFIGSHFAKRMAAAGHEVVVLDKLTYSGNRANLEGADVELVVGDICDADAVARAGEGCDAVVNFAAETHVDRSILGAAEFIETDVHGTYVLLGWTRDAGARLVQVSTDEVYGDVPEGQTSREDDPLRPSSPYSASKAGGDLQVLAAVRTYGIDACVTRGANTYGPNQYPEKLIPLFVTNALDGEPLPVYGDGRQRREWLHVEDHCAAVERVLHEGRRGEVYNVGGEEHENLEITRRILELTGASEELVRHVDDRAGHDRRYALDDSKLRGLGWSPEHSLGETGLTETVAWYRDNRAWWEPIKSGEYQRYYEEQYGARLG